jgi:hypothetical protein
MSRIFVYRWGLRKSIRIALGLGDTCHRPTRPRKWGNATRHVCGTPATRPALAGWIVATLHHLPHVAYSDRLDGLQALGPQHRLRN